MFIFWNFKSKKKCFLVCCEIKFNKVKFPVQQLSKLLEEVSFPSNFSCWKSLTDCFYGKISKMEQNVLGSKTDVKNQQFYPLFLWQIIWSPFCAFTCVLHQNFDGRVGNKFLVTRMIDRLMLLWKPCLPSNYLFKCWMKDPFKNRKITR